MKHQLHCQLYALPAGGVYAGDIQCTCTEKAGMKMLLALKKQDADLTPGFMVTPDFALGHLRGWNEALEKVIELVVMHKL